MHSPEATRRPSSAKRATSMSIGHAREQAPQALHEPPRGPILIAAARLVTLRMDALGQRYLQNAL
jgi:hypothetical protein